MVDLAVEAEGNLGLLKLRRPGQQGDVIAEAQLALFPIHRIVALFIAAEALEQGLGLGELGADNSVHRLIKELPDGVRRGHVERPVLLAREISRSLAHGGVHGPCEVFERGVDVS